MTKSLSLIIFIFFFFSFVAKAQSDSSDYDLGRIFLKKEFTQSITVKGSDLERYQFSDLADAINVWFYGTYSNASTLVYVIDGNIINDVNAYSIYDVDEITLVQNALAQVSGISPSQQMVLIKLKTNRPGKGGIEAAGQTSMVSLKNPENSAAIKTTTSLYDQYYLSGYKNYNNFSFGLSADYQRDVYPGFRSGYNSSLPLAYNFSAFTPTHFGRFKLNGYANANLWKGSTLSFGITYVPQENNYSVAYTTTTVGEDGDQSQNEVSNITQHLININFNLKSQIINGFTNSLSATYNHYNFYGNGYLASVYNPGVGYDTNFGYEYSFEFSKIGNLLIRDNLAYTKKLKDIEIRPSLNFSFRNAHNLLNYNDYASSGTNYLSPVSSAYYSIADQFKSYMLSPSINIVFKDFLNVQGGFVGLLNPDKDFYPGSKIPRFSPFLTTSADIAKIAGLSDFDFKIFASFSRQNALLDDEYESLIGVTSIISQTSNGTFLTSSAVNPTTISIGSYSNPYPEFNNYQAGAILNLNKNFTINYSFEYRFYETLGEIALPYGENEAQIGYIDVNDKTITNRLGLTYDLKLTELLWKIGLNAAETKVQLIGDPGYIENDLSPDYLTTGHRWSGGLANRFAYKTFFAGLDVLYQIGERPISIINGDVGISNYVAPSNANSFSLQSIYAGAQIKIKGIKQAEVFLNGRNILQNKASDITDNRRFFGFGFKAGL